MTSITYRHDVRVYYEDTDAGGVVYYANYLAYYERARTELLRSLGFEQDKLIASDDVLFAVTRVDVRYLKPARFNDLLAVYATVARCGKVGIEFEQRIERMSDGNLLSTATVEVACLSASKFKPTAIPGNVKKALES